MIGFTLLIVFLVSLTAGFGLYEINSLSGKIHEIHNKSYPIADSVMEIRVDFNNQMTDLHAYLLGESEAKTSFMNADHTILSYFTNLTNLLGSNSELDSAKTYYSTLIRLSTEKENGLFDLTDSYNSNNQQIKTDYQNFLTLHTSINNLVLTLEAQAAPETGHNNATISDELLTFNSILWETQNLVTKAYIQNDNNIITNLQNEFLYTNNGDGNNESINAELQRINNYINGGLLDNSISAESPTYYNQINNLILNGNSTSNSWISYGIDSINGIFAKKSDVNKFQVTKDNILTQVDNAGANLTQKLDSLELLASNKMDAINSSTDFTFLTLGFLALLIGFVALTIGLAFARSISKPIKEVAEFSKILSQGDLSKEVTQDNREDEIGTLYHSFSDMTDFLKGIIRNIVELSQILATSAEEMASSSEEVNASSEEISSISQQMSKGAQDQSRQISESISYSKTLRENFESKISEINSAADLIESISSQVNMLALNASIEAARAGEYGRGFAVVADNIRNLADDSKISVNKVQSTIFDLRESLGSSINAIIDSVERVASVAEETASGAEESSAATEEQAATMEELTASAQELSSVASKLENVVKQFTL